MIKIATLAAVASIAMLGVSAPANASEIRLATAGKTVAQLDVEITTAARAVCKRDVEDALISRLEFANCYKTSLAEARVELQKFAAAEGHQFASR